MPRRPESFDQVAALYQEGRPGYPGALIAELADAAGLGAGSRVLEIGCGTGQLSVPLAELGTALTAVEPGSSLAAIARRRLAAFPRAEVIVERFEDWPAPSGAFDLVVAATSFHWLDPAVRTGRAVAALRPGGVLAVIETHWGVSADPDDDRFSLETQDCYARWDPEHRPGFRPTALADLPESNEEFALNPEIDALRLWRHDQVRRYSAAGYRKLLGTWSNIIGLDIGRRDGLLGCITGLITERFGGSVERHDVYDLWLASKRAPRASLTATARPPAAG
jgi:SAM-dependent methyltransferase